jgi:hypothetical protein
VCGLITNIFRFDVDWEKPDNFILTEILYYLVMNRKRVGQIGLEGFWTCQHIAEELQRLGYVRDDVFAALNYLLRRQLITADHLSVRGVNSDDSVRIAASGFMHMRFLPGRMEYLCGIIPTTPVFDETKTRRLAEFVSRENSGQLGARDKAYAAEVLYSYLFNQKQILRDAQPLAPAKTGAILVLQMMDHHLQHFWHRQSAGSDPGAELDLV